MVNCNQLLFSAINCSFNQLLFNYNWNEFQHSSTKYCKYFSAKYNVCHLLLLTKIATKKYFSEKFFLDFKYVPDTTYTKSSRFEK